MTAPAVTASVFVGMSLDGFLARPDGALDWLMGSGEGGQTEDTSGHGYEEFIAGIDAVVMGRKTYEKVLAMGRWFYGEKRVVVLSSRPVDLAKARALGGVAEQMAGPPAEIMAHLAASGARRLYVDGGATIQNFLRAGLIHRLITTRVPVLIGQGVPLFGPLAKDVHLKHVSTRVIAGGAVQSEYEVLP